MNSFQKCLNTSDAVPLYLPQGLFLKPRASVNISVKLSPKIMGKTIMHGEMIQKIQELIVPDKFTTVNVIQSTVEFVRMEGNLELKSLVPRVVAKLDKKYIKLQNFNEVMLVKAAESKGDFPSRHDCDAFFRDAKDMDENKPGERPDTVHISNVPIKWFVPRKLQHKEDLLPSEKIFYYAFEKFGPIRNVDIPICDPYRCKMKANITGLQSSSFNDGEYFEGYVQFKDYIGFTKCMDALRGMQLLCKETENSNESDCVNIFVSFDKSKHLSEGNIRRRQIVRERLVLKQKTKDDKEREKRETSDRQEKQQQQHLKDLKDERERRRRDREEKRKAKVLAQLKSKDKTSEDFNLKIAKEERKLLKVQRRLEAIRLIEELFRRVKVKLEKEVRVSSSANDNQLTRMRQTSEEELKHQRDKLQKAIDGRVILKSIISSESKRLRAKESSSDNESLISSLSEYNEKQQQQQQQNQEDLVSNFYHHYLSNPPLFPPQCNPGFYPSSRGWYYPRGGRPGTSYSGRNFDRPFGRPFARQRRGRLKHYNQHDDRREYSRSSSRRSRSRSRSRRKTRRHSRKRSYSRSKSRSRSRSSNSSRSYTPKARRSKDRRKYSSERSHSR